MKPIALIILMFLVGCVPGGSPESTVIEREHSDIIVIGDSLCDEFFEWPHYSKISSDCLAGRPATQYEAMPSGRRVILYALLTNDVSKSSVNEYRAQMRYHFSQVDARIICLMPSPVYKVEWKNEKLPDYQQVMREECNEIIDMRDNGYLHSAPDGVHGGGTDNQDFGNYILGLIEAGDI